MVQIPRRFNRFAAAFDVVAARTRPPCDSSSGSDHFPEETQDLWDLIESFIDREVKVLSGEVPPGEENDDKSDADDDDDEDVKERLREILENHGGGGERRRIIDEVVNASELVGEKRYLMAYLRKKGFDAGRYTNAINDYIIGNLYICIYVII